MSFFDKLKDSVESVAKSVADDIGDRNDGLNNATCKPIIIGDIPPGLSALQAADGADMKDPHKVVALTIASLCMYSVNKDECIDMLNFLKGPRPLSNYEIGFMRDRLVGKEYVPVSYFEGATPENNYEPKTPLTVNVYETSHTKDLFSEGYLQLYVKSGGADSARLIKLRHKPSTGQWFLWEQFLLPDIRKPVKLDPWA